MGMRKETAGEAEVTKAEASVEGMAGEHTGQNPAGQDKGRKAGAERDLGFWQ